jgi:hypothetical protein
LGIEAVQEPVGVRIDGLVTLAMQKQREQSWPPSQTEQSGEKGLGQGGDQEPDGHSDRAHAFLCGDGRTFLKDHHLCSTTPTRPSVFGFINKCINDFVPTVIVCTYPNQKPWITGNIRIELKTRAAAFMERETNSYSYKKVSIQD